MFKWQIQYTDEIKACNSGSPDREARMMKDYEEKGYCEMDMWSLAVPVAKFILPRLIDFKDIVKRDKNRRLNYSASLKDFDAMIYSLKKLASDDYINADHEERIKIQKGLDLFSKHLIGMWC